MNKLTVIKHEINVTDWWNFDPRHAHIVHIKQLKSISKYWGSRVRDYKYTKRQNPETIT